MPSHNIKWRMTNRKIKDIKEEKEQNSRLVDQNPPLYLFTIVKASSLSSYAATGVKKSLGLASPLAPIGPRLGSSNLPWNIYFC